jgi:hypothetical protein
LETPGAPVFVPSLANFTGPARSSVQLRATVGPRSASLARSMDAFADALRPWHDYFMLTGASAATLMGLVFVAVSLGGNVKRASMRILETFVSPIVLQFGHVLLLAALVVVPTHRPWTLALACGGLSLFVLLNVLDVLRGMVAHHRAGLVDRNKWVWNFGLPFVAALAAVAASGELFFGATWALDVLAASSAMFVAIGVRNTWRLVMWILEHRVPDAGPG